MRDDGVPLFSGFQHKGGGKGEDENRDGCWSQKRGLGAWGGWGRQGAVAGGSRGGQKRGGGGRAVAGEWVGVGREGSQKRGGGAWVARVG